jgi:hypothetical protein
LKRTVTTRSIAALAMLSALVVATWPPWPSHAQVPYIRPVTQVFTTSGSPPIIFCNLTGQNSGTFQATGSGPIDVQVSNDTYTYTNTTISTLAGTAQAQPLSPTSGVTYQFGPINGVCVRIAPDPTWSGQTVTVTAYVSGASSTIAGSGGGGATPIPTPAGGVYPVSCAPPGQNPCSVHDSAPVQPSPLYTQPVTTPAPAATCTPDLAICVHVANTPTPIPTASPGGGAEVQRLLLGSGNPPTIYLDTLADSKATTANITTATTTQIIAPVAGESIYISLLTWLSGGTNAAATAQFEYGSGATCGTGTGTFFPAALQVGTAAGEWLPAWSSSLAPLSSASGMPGPASVVYPIPAGDGVCIVTAGTTINGYGISFYAQH